MKRNSRSSATIPTRPAKRRGRRGKTSFGSNVRSMLLLLAADALTPLSAAEGRQPSQRCTGLQGRSPGDDESNAEVAGRPDTGCRACPAKRYCQSIDDVRAQLNLTGASVHRE